MNYLQLGQFLHREGRYAGTAPTTMQNQTGQALDIAEWIKLAWMDIQREFDGKWNWQQRKFTLATVAAQSAYPYTDAIDLLDTTAISRFHEWKLQDRRNPAKIYLTSAGVATERWVIWTPWESFEQVYGISSQNDSMPVYITVDPQDNIVLGPTPNDVYTIRGEYWRAPQELSADDDIPECKSHFHEAIGYRALAKYGYAGVAQEHIQRANVEGLPILNALRMNQGATRRRFGLASPMA